MAIAGGLKVGLLRDRGGSAVSEVAATMEPVIGEAVRKSDLEGEAMWGGSDEIMSRGEGTRTRALT